MSAERTIREYYESLRRGEPLYPYFAERTDVRKFGVGETLSGYDEVAEGLLDQTRATTDWTVESTDLWVAEEGDTAWFSDEVALEWSDERADERYSFETRWSGTLVRRDDDWLFVGMHVSAPYEL